MGWRSATPLAALAGVTVRTARPGAVAFVASLIAATLFLLEPLKSAVVNWDELSIGFSALLRQLALPFAFGLAAALALAFALCVAAPTRGLALLVATHAGLWAQGNLFVWRYGSLDGSPIDWEAHSAKGLAEIAVWAAFYGLALLRPAPVRRHAVRIALGVAALQLAAFAEPALRGAPFPEKAEYEGGDDDGLGVYSSDRNVIVIVLDMLQSDVFAEAMRDAQTANPMPPGFIYFRNAVSLYTSTEFSLQSMLTSRAVPDGVPTERWLKGVMRRSLAVRLARMGFDSALLTFTPWFLACKKPSPRVDCVPAARFASSDPRAASAAVARHDASQMFHLGLFRLAPHFAKPRVYDGGRFRLPPLFEEEVSPGIDSAIHPDSRRDLAVFDRLIGGVRAQAVAPRFRFLHFYGSHWPVNLDPDCRAGSGPSDEPDMGRWMRASAVAAAQCMLRKTFAYLQALDEAGVYDRSLIFVVSDHGHAMVPIDVSFASPPLPEDAGRPPGEEGGIEAPGRGVPLFLAKRFADRSPLRISDRPVSLCDIPSSILAELGFDGFACEPIFSDRQRVQPRMHYRYPAYSAQPKTGPLVFQFEKYEVVGHSWRSGSWAPRAAADGAAR